MPIIECVPNISEGRDLAKVERIIANAKSVEGATLISCESDADHNRSVITLAGTPEGVSEAAFQIYAAAKVEIDLTKHEGEHPRMGAVDVCPFIPVSDASMEDCVKLAQALAKRVGEELELPIYLYEAAASRPERKNLADIRKGQFEKLRDLIGNDPDRVPDFGPNAIHPSFGCSAIGARFFLVAWNVNLDSDDIALAKSIGKAVREKDGG
ncbi:MAG: glutamate formimidoyltransferase, partial [Planctomycetes bacterium]|nr:glutamate formimidoyltransferase [Planctomycetota bacterium]